MDKDDKDKDRSLDNVLGRDDGLNGTPQCGHLETTTAGVITEHTWHRRGMLLDVWVCLNRLRRLARVLLFTLATYFLSHRCFVPFCNR